MYYDLLDFDFCFFHLDNSGWSDEISFFSDTGFKFHAHFEIVVPCINLKGKQLKY